ncbi:MAG: NTPase [Archaeoglobi archaeon]|nr:NTPase [Candidatus Mnemosynella bozhongmuii]
MNILITGKPGCGKTTLISRIVEELRARGFRAGGICCPEIRERGRRVGFMIVDLMSGESRILSHISEKGPKVGKYGVNVRNVDEMSRRAIERALNEADLIVIDEIAPMEVLSDVFRRYVLKALSSEKPLLAAVHEKSSRGFIGEIKGREDVLLFTLTADNRERLFSEILSALLSHLGNTSQHSNR